MTELMLARKPKGRVRDDRPRKPGPRVPAGTPRSVTSQLIGEGRPTKAAQRKSRPFANPADPEDVRRLLEMPIEFIDHPSFSDPEAEAEILAPGPEPDGARRRVKAPKDLPPYLAALYDDPLLTKEEECASSAMNFLKAKAARLRDQLDPANATTAQVEEIDNLLRQANEVKNRLIKANLRLVVSIAKRHVGPLSNFFELVSDGNMSLIRAVEKFDFSRGNKFSTYASWAVINNFARSIPGEAHHRGRFITGHEEMFESAADTRSEEVEAEGNRRQVRETVRGMLNRLDDRERRIIASRYGLDGAIELTLEQLGKELGITKERVRQIESRAQNKLRQFAVEGRIDPTEL